jgi:hypothetical protein
MARLDASVMIAMYQHTPPSPSPFGRACGREHILSRRAATLLATMVVVLLAAFNIIGSR